MTALPRPAPRLSPQARAARQARVVALKEAMTRRVLVLDGAMGTMLQQRNLKAADFGGPEFEGCNEVLVATRPDVIRAIHDGYFAAGADITETNSFGGTPLVLAEFDLGERAHELNVRSAQLARESAEAFSTPERPRWVAGSMGPTTRAISVTGGVTFEELVEQFEAQCFGLLEGGVDYLLIETCQDTRNVKAAILGAQQAFARAGESIPLAVSGTIEPMGTMLAGQSVEALSTSLEHLDLLVPGPQLRHRPGVHDRPPAHPGRHDVARRCRACPTPACPTRTASTWRRRRCWRSALRRFVEQGWLNVVGGCCGTHSGHIEVSRRAVQGPDAPGGRSRPVRSRLSGVDCVEVDDVRPLIVGERTNVIGSRKFKELIVAGKAATRPRRSPARR